MARSVNSRARRVRSNFSSKDSKGIRIPSGLYYGIVVDDNDETRKMNRVKVNISKMYGMVEDDQSELDSNPDGFLGAIWCRYPMPIGGITQPNDPVTDGQVMYGIWGSPPGKNTEVLVALAPDHNNSGVIIGVFPDESRNYSFPGIAADDTPKGRGPATERSKTVDSGTQRPAHPIFDQIKSQGLIEDMLRGLTSSGMRRESPSRVTGMSTPGGHSIVMDDGDESGTNNQIRIRSRQGAQFLLDDETGVCYFINQAGTLWTEATAEGDLDVYAAGSINYHSEGDFNVHSKRNINFHAESNINIKAQSSIKISALSDLDMHTDSTFKLTAEVTGNIHASGGLRQTAARIDLNGPAAAKAEKPTDNSLSDNTNVTSSVASRVPEHEPWKGHKN